MKKNGVLPFKSDNHKKMEFSDGHFPAQAHRVLFLSFILKPFKL